MAADLVDRLIILVVVRRSSRLGAADSRSLWSESYTNMKEFVRGPTSLPFRRFLRAVHREYMQRLAVFLHGTLGFCLL
jgi:hypothetical protein